MRRIVFLFVSLCLFALAMPAFAQRPASLEDRSVLIAEGEVLVTSLTAELTIILERARDCRAKWQEAEVRTQQQIAVAQQMRRDAKKGKKETEDVIKQIERDLRSISRMGADLEKAKKKK